MPLITICDGCGEEIEGVTQGRYELEIPTGNEWWASERLTFHGRACLALWVDRTDPDGTFCPQCAPDALPPGAESPERISENHYAVRFATREFVEQYVGSIFGECPQPGHIRPIVNGADVTGGRIRELLTGEDGWALAESTITCPLHGCFRVQALYGNVSIERIEPS